MSDNSLYPVAIRAARKLDRLMPPLRSQIERVIHAAIDEHLKSKGWKEPSPRPRRSRFAKGDIVTFTHKGEVKRGQVVEVDVDDEPTARLTVWLQGIWVKVHPDHCVREE